MIDFLIGAILIGGILYLTLIRLNLHTKKDRVDTAVLDEWRAWHAKQDAELLATVSHDEPDQEAVAETRRLWGYPPKEQQVLEEVLPAEHTEVDWDYVVHIHEGAEQYLGAEVFASLQKLFAGIPGVDECRHEDREVFLIRTKVLSVEELRQACWQQFLRAAKTAFGKKGKR